MSRVLNTLIIVTVIGLTVGCNSMGRGFYSSSGTNYSSYSHAKVCEGVYEARLPMIRESKRRGINCDVFNGTFSSPPKMSEPPRGLNMGQSNTLPISHPLRSKPVKQELPPPSTGPSIEEAKKECAELGFKPKTEKFGTCVLQLTDN